VAAARVELTHSARPSPAAADRGPLPDAAPVSVTLHLKDPDEPAHPAGGTEDLQALLRGATTRRGLALARARSLAPGVEVLTAFAADHGLKLGPLRAGRRSVRLHGDARAMRAAFGADLRLYGDGKPFRGRVGSLETPTDLAPWVRAVLGFEGSAAARGRGLRAQSDPTDGLGLWPREMAALYGLPGDAHADGQCIGVIAPSGGYQASDLDQAAALIGRASGPVTVRGGVLPAFGQSPGADLELALDLQVLADIARGARLAVYPIPNSIERLPDAIHTALFDATLRPQVLSLSWSSAEAVWPADLVAVMQATLADAVRLRVSVVAAAGDDLATGGLGDGLANLHYPASSPYALACGGTRLTLSDDGAAIIDEVVWNDGLTGRGTGGGVSALFDRPVYQAGLAVPPSVNPGAPSRDARGAPDVSAAASSLPGYSIILDGRRSGQAGTSAATPLWAGLIAIANAQRETPLGLPHPALYAAPAMCRGVVSGDNRFGGVGYQAGPGWNACAGLGAPRAAEVIQHWVQAP